MVIFVDFDSICWTMIAFVHQKIGMYCPKEINYYEKNYIYIDIFCVGLVMCIEQHAVNGCEWINVI